MLKTEFYSLESNSFISSLLRYSSVSSSFCFCFLSEVNSQGWCCMWSPQTSFSPLFVVWSNYMCTGSRRQRCWNCPFLPLSRSCADQMVYFLCPSAAASIKWVESNPMVLGWEANKPEKMEVLLPGVYQMLKDIILGVICLLVCPVLCDTRGETCQNEVQFH